MKKKILSIALLAGVSLSLASCGSDKVNTTVPYGSLSDTTVYATSNGNTLSEKKLYDLMRKDGYSTVTGNIKKQLFSDVTSNYFDYTNKDDRYQINASVVNAIYGVSTVENYEKLSNDSKETQAQKYVDTLFNDGIKKEDGTYYTVNDILNINITSEIYEGEDVFEATFPKEFYEDFIYDIAMTNYAATVLKDSNSKYYYKNEYIDGSGKNPYYVDDDDVKEFYHSTGKYYGEYKGIVIKFTSQAQAERVIKSANNNSLTISGSADEVLETYINIYNQRYTTREKLTVSNYLDDNNVDLSVSKKKNRLTSYSSSFSDMFKNMSDGEYLKTYFNVDGEYYLIYRISGFDVVEWNDLDEAQKIPSTTDSKTVYDEMLDYVLENKNTTTLRDAISSDRYDEIYDATALKIYDPVYAALYHASNDDYELANYSNSDLVYEFSYNDITYSLSVDDLYKELEKEKGMSKAIDYLTDKYVLSLSKMVDKIDSDDVDDYSDNLKDEIKSFKKGKSSYSKSVGEECYLQLTYGYNTKDEVVEAYKASLVEEKMLTYYGNFEAADGTTFNTDSALFKNFVAIYKELYDNYFNVSLSHILIGIDEEGDGDYTDPDLYKSKLSLDLQEKLDACILELSNLIIDEVKALTISLDVKDALTYIAEAFNNNYKIATLSYTSGSEVTWADIKDKYQEFPLAMKSEDLNELTSLNASSYVNAFSNRAKELYQKIQDGDILESDIEDKGVFEYSEHISDTSVLCKTVYGYHLLNVYDTDKLSSAKFEESSDSKADSDDEYKQYEHVRVIIEPDGDDDDDDPDYVLYTNGYSSEVYASTQQLFIYFWDYANSGSVTGLKSSVSTAIETLFSGVITEYQKSAFKSWRVLKYQLNISFEGDTDNAKLNEYIEYLSRSLFDYATSDYTLYTNWVDGTYDWTVDFN